VKHKKIIGIIATVMLMTALAVIPVAAQVLTTPCPFQGSVTLDGVACPGAVITVTLEDGTPLPTLPEEVITDEDSNYALVIPPDPAEEDAVLNFYVNGYLGGSSTWQSGGGAAVIKTLNLAATTGPVTYYALTTAVSPAGSGTVSPSSGTYAAGTVVTLTATAAADYSFSSWSGTDNNAINPTTVTMTSDKSVTAHFTGGPEYPSFMQWLIDWLTEWQ